jgi:hypothetical protein
METASLYEFPRQARRMRDGTASHDRITTGSQVIMVAGDSYDVSCGGMRGGVLFDGNLIPGMTTIYIA